MDFILTEGDSGPEERSPSPSLYQLEGVCVPDAALVNRAGVTTLLPNSVIVEEPLTDPVMNTHL